MKSIAVFCGSSNGASEVYKEEAVRLAHELVRRNLTLVYGGASVGNMGTVADTVLELGGKAVGVIPAFLSDREIAHDHLTELIVVDTMHERKQKMIELSDGFIALPGGPGTMEEFFEVFTWSQIGLHQKPCGILNVHHYYDGLLSFFDHMTKEAFMKEQYRSSVLASNHPADLLDQCTSYLPPAVKTYQVNQ